MIIRLEGSFGKEIIIEPAFTKKLSERTSIRGCIGLASAEVKSEFLVLVWLEVAA